MKANKKVKENGITPAWAGKSRECRYALTNEWDHPRVGGEKQMERQAGRLWVGSPPRGRGKARGPRFFDVVGGITPAWAGKSRECRYALTNEWDHPRVGGEKQMERQAGRLWVGSPPRGRGKARGPRFFDVVGGITPAWAGKSRECRYALTNEWDHPRVGGEKGTQGLKGQAWEGSPPHGRGKARHLSHGLLPCG